ncbi:hypothetical protein B0H19DRAFT_1250436 [Mycena capillaripes]|nr:hypothetical protein B0H19DRAFT_1250436 [Mycena capillaripes]
MVLTRRQRKAISCWLPNEIISEIFQAAPAADRAALCGTSKLFYGIGAPVLYRVIDEALVQLRNYLPRFASLLFLSVTTYFDDTWLNVGEVRNTVHDIVDACPSLKACRFNLRAWRKVNGTWEEYPADDFPKLAGVSVL